MRGASILGAATLGLAAVACAGVPVVGTVDLPDNAVESLANCGEAFRPMIAPAGAVAADAVLERLRSQGFPPFAPPGARPAPPAYGVIADAGPSTCRGEGLTGPGQQFEVWLVVWPTVSGANGGNAWAIVDAFSGELVVGDGPPGG